MADHELQESERRCWWYWREMGNGEIMKGEAQNSMGSKVWGCPIGLLGGLK